MKQYRLPVALYQTQNLSTWQEVPVLLGCRAWGDTRSEALDNLQSVAGEFILSYQKHGYALPKAALFTDSGYSKGRECMKPIIFSKHV